MSADRTTQDRDEILADLASADDEVRRLAVEALVDLPREEALRHWVGCLGDSDWRVRKAAVERLVEAPGRAGVVEALVAALADGDNPGRRNSAVEALVDIGEEALPGLVQALSGPDVDVRKFAVDSLAGIASEKARDPLIDRLQDEDANVRAAAADALGVIGGDSAVEALQAVARDGDPDRLVGFSALRALARLEVPIRAGQVAEALEDPTLRNAAFGTLGRCDDPEGVTRMLEAVGRGSRATRDAAIEALLRIRGNVARGRREEIDGRIRGELLGEAGLVDALTERLESADLSTRIVLVQFLGLLGKSEVVVPVLRAGRDEAVREIAHETLESLGETGVRALVEAWEELDSELRCEACSLLGVPGSRSGEERLRAALDDEDAELRSAAAAALGRARAVGALDDLCRRLEVVSQADDFDVEDELAALRESLVQIGLADPEARGRLVATLGAGAGSGDESRRLALADVLGRIAGPADSETVNTLLRDPSAGVRRAAVAGLARLEGGSATEALRLALADESPSVRMEAAGVLGDSGRGSALDDLRHLLHDEDERVRAAAVRAIGRLAADESAGVRAGGLELVSAAAAEAGAVALAAVEALRLLGGPDAGRAAAASLAGAEPERAQAAVVCIGEHGDAEALDALLPLVAHQSWSVRAEAIQVLGERGVVKALPAILRRMELEQDGFVRDAMLRATKRLEG